MTSTSEAATATTSQRSMVVPSLAMSATAARPRTLAAMIQGPASWTREA
jgi:hypothetical protein